MGLLYEYDDPYELPDDIDWDEVHDYVHDEEEIED